MENTNKVECENCFHEFDRKELLIYNNIPVCATCNQKLEIKADLKKHGDLFFVDAKENIVLRVPIQLKSLADFERTNLVPSLKFSAAEILESLHDCTVYDLEKVSADLFEHNFNIIELK